MGLAFVAMYVPCYSQQLGAESPRMGLSDVTDVGNETSVTLAGLRWQYYNIPGSSYHTKQDSRMISVYHVWCLFTAMVYHCSVHAAGDQLEPILFIE
jgi:hypothetical protein